MKFSRKHKAGRDVLNDLFPQAISALKKNLIAPLFSENLFEKYGAEKEPLRSELFTLQQMEQHARSLAGRHILAKAKPSERMLKRLGDNERILMEVHSLLTEEVKEGNTVDPAGEWLLDNFYLIEEQVFTGKKHLPKGYSKGLP
jgi:hypothetical protein